MKKRYRTGTKLLAALALIVSLLAASFGGVVTVYGLAIGALSQNDPTETGYVRTLAMSGPGGNGFYGQSIEDMQSYYESLQSDVPEERQKATVYKSEYAPQRSNVRVRMVSVNSNGEMTGTLATLGGDWENSILASSSSYELTGGQMARIDVGFDRAFSVDNDALGQYLSGYRLVKSWNSIGLPVGLVAAAAVSAALAVYLLLAAGHRPDTDGIRLRAFDRWPVILLGVLLLAAFCIGQLIWESFRYTYTSPGYLTTDATGLLTSYPAYDINFMLMLTAVLLWGFALVSFFVLRSLTVRIKAHCLWRTTLIYYLCRPVIGLVKRRRADTQPTVPIDSLSLEQAVAAPDAQTTDFVLVIDGDKAKEAARGFAGKAQDAARQVADKAQDAARQVADKARAFEWEGSGIQRVLGRLKGALVRAWRAVCDAASRMDIMWSGMLWGVCIIAAFWLISISSGLFFFPTVLAVGSLIGLAWVLSQLSRLIEGARHLSEGDLSYQIDTSRLHGPFRRNAEMLNGISRGCAVEVERRMKSEHLKTELLTNVSHDIKTPLTSIINYVDLLKKTDPQPEAAREYADVLERQSLRLKKLLEDLIEASKASTGNITVNLAPTDAAELLRQAVGEYSERLSAQSLETVLRVGGESCTITADGRLLWRVFDNLLGNVVKYAMPGTRVYLDLSEHSGTCTIIVKNISREALGIDPEELMERFVRGDASRATEGSGLGLSIARSLTECMGGRFALAVDGDLFKVTLYFPLCTTEPNPV